MKLMYLFTRAATLLMFSLLAACATVPPGGAAPSATAATAATDPWENWNRKVYAFNDTVDEAVLKPIATAWRDNVPALLRQGVSNFFGNVGDVWSTANHFLQGKVSGGLEMGMRVMSNTLFGLVGVLDPATEFGLTRRSEDFGQTLAVWGVGKGPYVVLPLLGPSTLRDSFALPLDSYASRLNWYFDSVNYYVTTPLQLVQLRAELLDTTKLLDQISLDKYSFVRDAFLARRLDQIHDGAPPLPTFEDEPADEAPKAAPKKP